LIEDSDWAELLRSFGTQASAGIKYGAHGITQNTKGINMSKRKVAKKKVAKKKLARNEKTSKKVASKASKLLRSKKSSKAVKSVAGSALTQAPNRKIEGTNNTGPRKK